MAVIVACFVALLLSNMAGPIYPLWQQDLGFSPGMINVLFAVYPAGVLTSLFGVMRLLKGVSWRAALLISVGAGLLASGLFVVADNVVVLVVARYACGLSVGIVLSTGASAVSATLELRGVRTASRIAAIIISGGFASGAMIAGIVADHAPHPTTLVFALETAALALAFAYLLTDRRLRAIDGHRRPHSPVENTGAGAYRVLPPAQQRAALTTATWVFVACGISCAVFQSIGSAYLKELLGVETAMFSSLLIFLVFGAAFGGQLALARATSPAQAWTALVAGGLGAALLLLGVLEDSIWALFAAAALCGASQGLGQATGFTIARETTELHRLPGVLSRLNVLAYGSAGGSILLTSPLVDAAGVGTAILTIATSVAVLTITAGMILVLRQRAFVFGEGPSYASSAQLAADASPEGVTS